jgi:hypothetical protein
MASEPAPRSVDLRGLPETLDELERMRAIAALAEHEMELERLAGRELEVRLQRRARVDAGAGRACKAPAFESLRLCEAAAPADEFGAVAGEAVRRAVGGDERYSLGKVAAPSGARENALRRRIELADDMRLLLVAKRAEHPLGVVRRGHASRTPQPVLEPEPQDLDRRVGRHEDRELLAEPMAFALVDGVAGAVSHESIGS